MPADVHTSSSHHACPRPKVPRAVAEADLLDICTLNLCSGRWADLCELEAVAESQLCTRWVLCLQEISQAETGPLKQTLPMGGCIFICHPASCYRQMGIMLSSALAELPLSSHAMCLQLSLPGGCRSLSVVSAHLPQATHAMEEFELALHNTSELLVAASPPYLVKRQYLVMLVLGTLVALGHLCSYSGYMVCKLLFLLPMLLCGRDTWLLLHTCLGTLRVLLGPPQMPPKRHLRHLPFRHITKLATVFEQLANDIDYRSPHRPAVWKEALVMVARRQQHREYQRLRHLRRQSWRSTMRPDTQRSEAGVLTVWQGEGVPQQENY